MMFRRFLLALMLSLLLALPALAERRVALVLGNESYRDLRPLGNPVNDARTIEELLKGMGFEVWLETDRDLKRMRRAFDDFRADAAGADVALLFYAGHGVALDGVNYLLPVDTRATSAEDLRDSAMSLAEAQAILAEVAPVSIILLDACRDDPFATGGSADGRGAVPLSGPGVAAKPPVVPAGLGRMGRADGVLFAFAAAPGETASDGSGDNSPFTAALGRHFATEGVELKTALTLVQQDVYDRSRGRQLPYVESGVPQLVFLSAKGELPERDRLLIEMAGLTPEIRAEVEQIAQQNDMPYAPLYAAVLSGDLAGAGAEERGRKLEEAARSFLNFQSDLGRLASDDPRVADLRARAQEQLALGAFETARTMLTEAAGIDARARGTLQENLLSRTLSEASTHVLNANAARTDLRYDLAVGDLERAVELFAGVEAELPDRDRKMAYVAALETLGELYLITGNSFGARSVHMTRAAFLETQSRADPEDIGWIRQLIWALNSVGSVLQQQGYLQEAETAFNDAFEFSRSYSDRFPDDPELMRDREVIRNKLGEVRQALADYQGALTAYLEALEIAKSLLETDPDDRLYLRDVSFTLERLGDVYAALQDQVSAREAYEASLQISRALAQKYPEDQQMQRDLSVSYERFGDLMSTEGDHDAALAIYLEALVIREDLAAADPGNALRQRDNAVTYERIGDIYNALGARGEALMSHMQALGLRETLVALDPQNTGWLRDLAVSYDRIGGLYLQDGDYDGAIEAYLKSRDLRQAVAAVDPSNMQRLRDLSTTVEKLALAEEDRGQPEAALGYHRETRSQREAVLAANPGVALYHDDLAITLLNIGNLQWELGDMAAAREALDAAVAQRIELVRMTPGDSMALKALIGAQSRLARFLLTMGEPAAALPLIEAAGEGATRLAALAPRNADLQLEGPMVLDLLADVRAALGDPSGRLQALRDGLAGREAVVAMRAGDYDLLDGLAYAQTRLASALIATGDSASALQVLSEAEATVTRMAELRPALDGHLVDAMLVANLQGDALRDGQDLAGATGYYRRMAELGYQLSSADPYNVGRASDYAIAMERLGNAQFAAKDYAAAAPSFGTAVDLRRWLAGQAKASLIDRRSLAFALQKLADSHYLQGALEAGAPAEREALEIMRAIAEAEPDDPLNMVDLATALDRASSYDGDPAPKLREALAVLQALDGAGQLPAGPYRDWIARYQRELGGG